MSASDYIARKKYDSIHNILTTKNSSSETVKRRINVIRNVVHVDENGDSVTPKWFNVPITTLNCHDISYAHIVSDVITTPLMSKPPEMTIEPALKVRKNPPFCASCFPTKRIYTGQGEYIPGMYDYIECNQCGGDEFMQYCSFLGSPDVRLQPVPARPRFSMF